ncbi:DUF305 domain-containing protein [Phaeobacter piscinae]|uniref:DUF305 domain-containing protein n=1 Tax=Phaeobacter piscinae TaxID=1580596 RepID=UPI0039F658E4
MAYSRFFLMIAVSTILMLGLMYLNTFLTGHVFWSETRAYMAVVMGAAMAFVMLAFMLGMYENRTLNIAIFAGSIVVFAGALWLVRSQETVQDRSYMRAMIPHHSIAIMTSSRAEITDPRVRALADDIIYAQDKEIAEMRYLIADISANGEAAPKPDALEPELKNPRTRWPAKSSPKSTRSSCRAMISRGYSQQRQSAVSPILKPARRCWRSETAWR